MNTITHLSTQSYVAVLSRLAAFRSERGSVTSEYGAVVLVAIAIVLSVVALFTRGIFDKVLTLLIEGIMDKASDMSTRF